MKKSALVFLACLIFSSTNIAQTLDWAKSMGGANWDMGTDIAVDASGNIYTTGWFIGTVDFDPNAGIFNLTSGEVPAIFIQKLDVAGNLVWAKSMGFGLPSEEGGGSGWGLGITIDSSGNVYTTGWFVGTVDFDPNAGVFNLTTLISTGEGTAGEMFVQKLDTDGNFIWAKSTKGNLINLPYTTSTFVQSITIDPSGDIYTTGAFVGTVDFDPNAGVFNLTSSGLLDYDIFIQKLDADGNFIWAKSMGNASPNLYIDDTGRSIAVDSLGNVYTTGEFWGTVDFDPNSGTFNLTAVDSTDIFIQKLDAGGNFIWAKSMGGTQSDRVTSIALDESVNVYTTGWFGGTVDFDPNAGAFNLTAVNSADIYIQKLDVGGNFIWAKSMGGTQPSGAQSIAVDASGNVYTTGSFGGTVDFDPNAGVYNLTAVDSSDIFIEELDADGNFLWAKSVGGANSDVGTSLTLDGSGNIYTTGFFGGTVDFDPNAGVYNLTAVDSLDIFIQKLTPTNCPIPGNYFLFETDIAQTSATLQFNLTGYQLHDWRYRVAGTGTWTELSTTIVPDKFVSGLSECTDYEWQINLQCSNGEWTGWFGLGQFVTECSGLSTTFTVNSALVNSCQEVCIPISVSNFVDIIGFQFSIHYDASLLEFVDINGFNLPNLDVANFGIPPMTSAGNINVSWLNVGLTPVTLSDNSEIFQMCFNVKGNVGDTADIFISGTPTAIEVIHAADPIPVQIPPILYSGTVSIISSVISFTSYVTPSTCLANNGSIDLSIGGGAPPYSITWDNGATTEDIFNLSPGFYTPTITDANGCELVGDAIEVGSSVSSVNISVTVTDVSCNGNNDGSIDLTVTGGAPPYSFEWTPNQGGSIEDLTNLGSNVYTVTVTDVNGCTSVASSLVSEPAALNISAVVTHQNVGDDGAIDVSVNGGTPPYTFDWSPAQGNTGNPTGLAPGIYNLTVTDGNGCTETSSYTVNEADAPTFTFSVVNVLCNGDDSGEINVSIINGVQPFTYNWSGPVNPMPTGNHPTGLIAGTYMVTVTDGNGNTSVSQPITISEPPPISQMASIVNASCNGGSDGEIHLTVSGGTSPYSVVWSNGSVGIDLTGLMEGIYVPTITDANNCIYQGDSVSIVEINAVPTNYALTESDITQTEATLQINVNGYQAYDWRYKEAGANTWLSVNSSFAPVQSVSGLMPCTDYEWQVNLQCTSGAWTGWFGLGSFSTDCVPRLAFGDFYQFVEEGEIVEIPVLLKGFENLINFQFSINWDTSYFDFVEVQSVQSNLENFSSANIDDQPVLTGAGMLSTSWSNLANPNYILDSITQLFTFKLKAKNSICDTTIVEFSSMPLSIEFYNKDFDLLALDYQGREIFLNVDNCLTAVEDVEHENLIDIFPNPTSNEFYFNSTIKVVDLIIRDSKGSILRRYKAPPNKIDVSYLSPGIYFIEIISDDFKVIKKLIKI